MIGTTPRGPEELRKIATYQKGVLMCVVAQLAMVFLVAPYRASLPLGGILWDVLLFALVCAMITFVILLAEKLYGLWQALLCAVLSIVPLVGLIVLLMVSGRATTVLKEHGIRVGLLGANVTEIH